MNNLTLWQRLNLAFVLVFLFLAIGGAFAFWMDHSNSEEARRTVAANSASLRINLEIARHSDALRGALLKSAEGERKAVRDAAEALKDALRLTPAEQASSADALLRFVQSDLVPFDEKVLKLAESSPESAIQFYNTNNPAIHVKLASLSSEIGKQSSVSVFTTQIVCSVGILLAGVAALVVARYSARGVTAPMTAIVGALEPMQRGDFTRRLQMQRNDEFGTVGNGMDKLADELSILVGQVQRSGIQVNSTATEIAATAREQQSTANEIAATTAEIGATSKEISATSKELVKTMNEVSRVSEETADLAGSGQHAIGKMEGTMRQIMEASGSITGKLAVLSEKTSNINTVVTTITKVADQTNLLSLNAAIEAEKAGEYGLGFAVVAMEIRRLADQTAVATYDIEKMVKEMQSAVAAGVMGMDKFSEEVRRGVDEVRQVGTQLAQIIHQVQTLTPRFQTVNEGMHAQATGAQQISETLTQLNEAAQLTAESLRQSNIAIEQLNEAARGLQSGVARFKLKGS